MSKRLPFIGVLAAVATATAAALATTPGTNGSIAFRRYLNDEQSRSALYVMNADGTNARRITAPSSRHLDDQPDWSPDGTRLVFTRCFRIGPCRIMVINTDGSGLRGVTPRCTKRPTFTRVPRGCEDASAPSFAPDGQHVTYTRSTGRIRRFPKYKAETIQHSAVAMIGIDGRGRRELLRLPPYTGDLLYPQMSPDGRHIAFEVTLGALGRPRFGQSISVMDADGSDAHRVTPWRLHGGDNPDWAPDSSRILFRSNEEVADDRSQIYTVRPDGTGLTKLTDFPYTKRRLFSASFSPDGSSIVYGQADAKGRGDLYVMNADGTGSRVVYQDPAWDSAPDWGAASNAG
jgi:TolB protein